ncbi:hypothetical protein [Kitasatospora sp. NPDC050543]|uniref:hypothetical protein n=1 Tax=Kitasatospora sp. NPDC050543 TaxID=3364054 RepID=UPI0037A39230
MIIEFSTLCDREGRLCPRCHHACSNLPGTSSGPCYPTGPSSTPGIRSVAIGGSYVPTDCYLDAWARTEADLERLTAAFPEARLKSFGKESGEFPVSVTVSLRTFGQVADALRIGVGICPLYVLWHNMTWPCVPELGLEQEHKYAELQIACNSHDIFCETPTPEHTVFLHSRHGDDERVAWLASKVGAQIAGPSELGW